MRSGASVVFCLHREELDGLAKVFRRDQAKTAEWLAISEVGPRLGMAVAKPHPLWRAWEVMQDAFARTGRTSFRGRDFRAEPRLNTGRPTFCLHESELEALAVALGARRDVAPKTDEWLTSREVADILGVNNTKPRFTDPWKALVAAAQAEVSVRDGAPVRFEMRKISNSYWCLHRDEVEWFAAYGKLPLPARKDGGGTGTDAGGADREGAEEPAMAGLAP